MLQKKKKNSYSRTRDTYETNAVEHKALFGLLYLAGINRSGHLNVEDFYASDGTVLEFFQATISKRRLKILLQFIRYDDVNTRQQKKVFDRLAPSRDLFENFVKMSE